MLKKLAKNLVMVVMFVAMFVTSWVVVKPAVEKFVADTIKSKTIEKAIDDFESEGWTVYQTGEYTMFIDKDDVTIFMDYDRNKAYSNVEEINEVFKEEGVYDYDSHWEMMFGGN